MHHPVDEASAALYINDPIKKEERTTSLFNTHPSISDRIERLRQNVSIFSPSHACVKFFCCYVIQ